MIYLVFKHHLSTQYPTTTDSSVSLGTVVSTLQPHSEATTLSGTPVSANDSLDGIPLGFVEVGTTTGVDNHGY